MSFAEPFSTLLAGILTDFGCQTGTIHRTLPDGGTLELVSQIGIPEILLEKIAVIPFGKGIAGAAAARREAVTLCNLQQDLGGVAKPDARKTGVAGSIAVPIFGSGSGQVIGTLGIGMSEPHDFDEDERRRLEEFARWIAKIFENEAAG